MSTLILAHYYTTPEVQALADYVGDSLDLAIKARDEGASKIIFAGVRFMAETAKVLNPSAKVILPNPNSTCSLVEQTDIKALKAWRAKYKGHIHVAYINSSVEHKATADIIVTSRIVDDVIRSLYAEGKKVIFSPDYNMGTYLNNEYGFSMPLWNAVCEVHDKFSLDELGEICKPGDILIAHPESPLTILNSANFIGSTHGMLSYIKEVYSGNTVWVATEEGLLYNMRELRPDLDIRQVPIIYKGCQCNSCPYMKYNTPKNVLEGGVEIDYLTDSQIAAAKLPIDRMLEYI